jgi:hypothetical protein
MEPSGTPIGPQFHIFALTGDDTPSSWSLPILINFFGEAQTPYFGGVVTPTHRSASSLFAKARMWVARPF